jgi:hypothetical protein
MLAAIFLILAGLVGFLLVCLLLAMAECRELSRRTQRAEDISERLLWENAALTRRLAERTRAVGRLLQTLAGDGTRRN